MALTPKEKHELRAAAHALKPIIMVGEKGITANVLNELDNALLHHELLKMKIAGADKESRSEAADEVCAEMQCELVQQIGNILVLYRKNPDPNFKKSKKSKKK